MPRQSFASRLAVGALFAAASQLLASAAHADEEERWNAHFQSTWVWQAKPPFRAAYSGPNSLSAAREKSYSFTATAAFGLRAWAGGEIYFDPELVQGVPMSGLAGLGGLSNGELQKTAGSNPVLYKARLFLRQRWSLGGEMQALESEAHQLAGRQTQRRLTLTLGNLAVSDLFDNNGLAHDARTQFLNWALLTHGAYDFAADSRGYTVGAALAYDDGDWTLRGGRFAMPVESNGLDLDWALARRHGDQLELEHRHTLANRPGVARLLVFRNVANSGSFADALRASNTGPAPPVPDLAGVRRDQAKRGWGLALEQELADGVSAFARIGANDGRTEAYAFAAIDRSASLGAVIQGQRWGRPADQVGIAWLRNGLSGDHQRFLAAGGSDFFLGDGALRYAAEHGLEAYYSLALTPQLWLSADAQLIRNPAYNADRGPVKVYSLRVHAEF